MAALVPTDSRAALTLPRTAALLGLSPKTLRQGLRINPNSPTLGTLIIPGGAAVPAFRSAMSGHWTIYRRHLDAAIDTLSGAA